MTNHTILGLALPTNEPETCFNYFLKSLGNMKEVAPITTILFNFQKPWTEELIAEAVSICESHGFAVRYSFNEYVIEGRGKVPMNAMRNDACKLMPEAKFFALTDDDFKYCGPSPCMDRTAGRQYLESIHYLTKFERCGLVLLGGSRVRKVARYHVAPTELVNYYVTGRGFILRSLGEDCLTLPKESIHLVGSDEERVSAASRLAKGYYPAKMPFSRTSHYENNVESGVAMYNWNDADILEENNAKFIRDNYNPKFKGKDAQNIIDPDIYYGAGGIDLEDKEVVQNHTVNYFDSEVSDLLSYILNNN